MSGFRLSVCPHMGGLVFLTVLRRRSLSVVIAVLALVASSAPITASAAGPRASPVSIQAALNRTGHSRARGLIPHLNTAKPHQAAALGQNPYCPGCSPPLVFHSANPVAGGLSHLTGPVGAVTITPYYWDP